MEPCPKYGIEIVAYMSKKKKKKNLTPFVFILQNDWHCSGLIACDYWNLKRF